MSTRTARSSRRRRPRPATTLSYCRLLQGRAASGNGVSHCNAPWFGGRRINSPTAYDAYSDVRVAEVDWQPQFPLSFQALSAEATAPFEESATFEPDGSRAASSVIAGMNVHHAPGTHVAPLACSRSAAHAPLATPAAATTHAVNAVAPAGDERPAGQDAHEDDVAPALELYVFVGHV